MRSLVIGLGNPILTDDGVGVKAARLVENRLPPDLASRVAVSEASVGGLRLMEMMIGYEHVILIDALQTAAQEPPGTIRQLTLEDLKTISPTQHSASAHDTSLVTALEMGERMGLALPREVRIIAVAVENIRDFSEDCTPEVDQAIPQVAQWVLDELNLISRVSCQEDRNRATLAAGDARSVS